MGGSEVSLALDSLEVFAHSLLNVSSFGCRTELRRTRPPTLLFFVWVGVDVLDFVKFTSEAGKPAR